MYGRAHAQRICLKLYLQSGRMKVLKEWCAGGQTSTKKELSHAISPKERSNNDRSVPIEKLLGNPTITPKKTNSKKAARERRGGCEYNSNIVFLLRDVH